MTAIAGLISLERAPIERAILERMRNLLAPYGRDAQRIHQTADAGFVRTLLRTTPGRQGQKTGSGRRQGHRRQGQVLKCNIVRIRHHAAPEVLVVLG